MRRPMNAAVAAALVLTVAWGQAAIASDAPVADGDLIDGVFESDADGPNDATQFGDVCPGRTYTREVRLAVRRSNANSPNSFVNGTTVTWGFFDNPNDPSDTDGSQEVDPSYGHLSTAYPGPTTMTMPGNWQGRAEGSLWPTGTASNPYIRADVTLEVPTTAPAGDPNPGSEPDGSDGTIRFRASGARTTGDPFVNRGIRNYWVVLDGDAAGCDRAPTVTASFSTSRAACGVTPELRVRIQDPDAAVTTEDGLDLEIDWGTGAPNVYREEIKAADQTLSFPAPYTNAGTYTATVTWSDGHLDGTATTGSTTATVAIEYDASGILQPVNADGSSIFKAGSTIPVKVRFTDCDGRVPSDLAPTIDVTKTGGSSPTVGTLEPALNTSAHTDGVLRFSDGQWIYNLSTKTLSDPTATYRLVITVPSTGQTVQVGFGLRA
jgi:hypothetical protein